MHITQTNYTVADYCAAMKRKEIIVNRAYQRSDKVWPPAAKSFLIESILLSFPIPKLCLYQVTDVKTRKTNKEIVDGQQRSQTIFDFYSDKFRLSKSSGIHEAAGKLYSQLEDGYKQSFLDYALSVDLFISATPDEIRETFRRINSYTVPLNPEEQRHAGFQGDFKWFIYHLSKKYDQNFVDMGVFSDKQLVRMADTKLFSEVIHAILYGITTTNKSILDKLYKDHDAGFGKEDEIERRIDQSLDYLLNWKEVHEGSLMRPHILYSLILAISHVTHPASKLRAVFEPLANYVFERDIALANLTSLAESLENPELPGKFREFVLASSSKTNVAEQRKIRLRWLCQALQPILF